MKRLTLRGLSRFKWQVRALQLVARQPILVLLLRIEIQIPSLWALLCEVDQLPYGKILRNMLSFDQAQFVLVMSC